jgi:hypothetical protein
MTPPRVDVFSEEERQLAKERQEQRRMERRRRLEAEAGIEDERDHPLPGQVRRYVAGCTC